MLHLYFKLSNQKAQFVPRKHKIITICLTSLFSVIILQYVLREHGWNIRENHAWKSRKQGSRQNYEMFSPRCF